MSKPFQYDYVYPNIRDWPLYRLVNERKAFMEEWKAYTVEQFIHRPTKSTLTEELARVLYMERLRMRESPWKIDPKDEADFWASIRRRLLADSLDRSDEEVNRINQKIVEDISARYVEEIMNNFKISTYRFGRRLLTFAFHQLLNTTARHFRKVWGETRELNEKFSILGSVEELRSLVKRGTIVVVPTHFSNLDSIVIGWAIDKIGLPAFSYGAGLNLFNTRAAAYFMGRLGAYRVDRRKKNPLYLETLKSFSRLTIERGVHSLFFPGGTRSRSGALEDNLKMGLLRTAVDAQVAHFVKGSEERIFIVPLALNYHFVLEAKSLIEQYLSHTGKERYLVERNNFGGYRGFWKFLIKFFSESSELVINFGKPMDVLGNFVDAQGNSLDQFARPLNLKEYFISGGELRHDYQRDTQYTQILAERISDRYRAETIVLSSQLVAFVAFKLLEKSHPKLEVYGVLRLAPDERVIARDLFLATLAALRLRLLEMEKDGAVKISAPVANGSPDDILHHGLQNLGVYHSLKPLKADRSGDMVSEDLNLLYYYHNRLSGFGLETHPALQPDRSPVPRQTKLQQEERQEP